MEQLTWIDLYQKFGSLHDSAQDLCAHWFWSAAPKNEGAEPGPWSLSGGNLTAQANFNDLAIIAASKLEPPIQVSSDQWLYALKNHLTERKHPDCKITGVGHENGSTARSTTPPILMEPTIKDQGRPASSEGGTIYWVSKASALFCAQLAQKPSSLGKGSNRTTATPSLNYRSPTKRAVLIQLTKNPGASDVNICRELDADGVDLPASWRNSPMERSFCSAYMNLNTRHQIEVCIGKVRADMRKVGALSPL